MTTLKGRELDEAIQTTVFGKTLPTREEMLKEAAWVWKTQHNCRFFSELGGFSAFPVSDGVHTEANCPRFSSDIKPAFQVVEKMREEGCRITMGWDLEEQAWYVSFKLPKANPTHGIADSLPEAICLAALEAKGVAPSVKAKV